ncbi:hypothetical protein G9A89_014648 [Geosiphon pyriformis]|nr:hypothetical protein G9A89_014648 [Geosiphon pyriformis]
MTTIRAKSKRAAPNICPEISNKISTKGAFFVVEATRQNVLEAFPLPSNHDKLLLIATPGLVPVLPLLQPRAQKFLIIDHTTSSKKIVKKTRSSEKWRQSLASAIVTPNPFVVPNKILDEISITLSDQPLAVLPNVVSSGRSLLVLEAKQSFSVESPVLGNWADQMETDSSPPLVSGATSGGAWETITSCHRFAGWVVSTLVPGATFRIKLAHVKTVFQSVHGFLGAKSVLKDNVKLFCVEFASQQSLEAVFLVELTSSVHLATLKIAKSLVVSESGSFSAAVALHDVPLGVFAANIKLALNVFSSVARVVLKPAGIWQYVVVYFEKLDSAVSALKHWSVLMDKDSVRILPLVNQNETILSRDKFKAKLVNLPSGCTVFEISDMISQIGVTFDSQGDLDSAVVKTGTLRKCQMGHLVMDCKISSPPTPKVPKVFKSCFVGSASYAKTAAPSGLSEFPSLVVSLAASVVDPAVGSRLNSLEKQISDLAALVKSIVKPVSFLVALVSCLLDDNAAKTVQIKKNLISMKSAVNNFSNLLVGVSKDIACLRSKINFSDMDYDSMLAAKSFFLSEDTIKHIIALWRMFGAKTRGNIESTRLFFSEFIFDSRNLNSIIERIRGLGLFLPTFNSA